MSHEIADRPLAVPKQFDDRYSLWFSESLQGRGSAHRSNIALQAYNRQDM
jgi:hypothetical protein